MKPLVLGPDNGKRFRGATAAAHTQLQAGLKTEHDPNVRQDLEILIRAADEAVESSEVGERLLQPWIDAPQLVFQGLANAPPYSKGCASCSRSTG